MRNPAELCEAFRHKGLKLTPQRQLLFRLLYDNPSHPSADSLYAQASELMPGISLRTVYQTLNDLAAMGDLQMVSVGSGPARFDPNVDDHHHAVCSRCGEVIDIYVADMSALQIDGLGGFRPESAQLVLSGTCQRCSSSITPTSTTAEVSHPRLDKERSSS